MREGRRSYLVHGINVAVRVHEWSTRRGMGCRVERQCRNGGRNRALWWGGTGGGGMGMYQAAAGQVGICTRRV